MIFKLLKATFLLLLFFPFSLTSAAESLDVIINEIAWMGTEVSYNDEWIELYNNTENNINLDGWVLKAADGTPDINLTGIIPPNGFYLLERTDDEAVPGISADLIYKGSSNNKGEHLKLVAKDEKIIDEVNCSSGWFAGDNETKRTMERKNPLTLGSNSQNWQASQNSRGTPKAKNSLKAGDSQEEKEPEIKRKEAPEIEEQATTYPSNIFINEVLPSPEGPDAENEWIEIFNQNDFKVNLSGWQIVDTVGRTKVYTLPEEVIIKAKGFLVLSRPITKITLNNSEDSLNLLQPNGKIIDRVSYEKAPRGKSFNKTDSGCFWSSTLTPGAPNIIPSSLLSEGLQEKTETQENETSSDSQTKKGIAAISEQIPKSSNFLPVLLIALIVAFLSGAIILLLRKKMNQII